MDKNNDLEQVVENDSKNLDFTIKVQETEKSNDIQDPEFIEEDLKNKQNQNIWVDTLDTDLAKPELTVQKSKEIRPEGQNSQPKFDFSGLEDMDVNLEGLGKYEYLIS